MPQITSKKKAPEPGALSMLWLPIEILADKYDTGLLLCAPELVDLDCNEHGIGMGYWQDGPVNPTYGDGTWLACKWDMHDDSWHEVTCTPTHFIKMAGPIR